jgi:O-glycosyl hydrolase
MIMNKIHFRIGRDLLTVILLFSLPALYAQVSETTIRIDGAKKFQSLDGFGVNINTTWWYNGEYRDAATVRPAIDLLLDSLGATIFRTVIEEIDWETVNDDNDPDHYNWAYYNTVFSSPRFQGVWSILSYLNSRGITDNLMISFMGGPPAPAPLAPKDPVKSWMGGTDYSISPGMEDEMAESIAALLYYMRNTAKIKFSLVSPMNETDVISWSKSSDHPDGIVEGPNITDPAQYVKVVRKLAQKLDQLGMTDVRFVLPDAASDRLFSGILDEMDGDQYLMGKLAHWGVHQYGNDAGNYLDIVKRPANSNKSYWVTETAGISNMLGQLDDNASAYIFWDGFDCVYQHARRNGYGDIPPNDWAFWMPERDGKPLIEYIASDDSWKPRKQFYEHAQLMKFIKPGAERIGAAEDDTSLTVDAFRNHDGQLVIVGQNKGNFPVQVRGELLNLPLIDKLEMFCTDADENLKKKPDITMTGNQFFATIPAGCVFTLKGGSCLVETLATGVRPEPESWYAGDIHIHRNCGEVTPILPENLMTAMMEPNDLAVISVLADMGNGEVKDSRSDLPKVNGKDADYSLPGKIVHWDAEWHFDPAGVTFENKALGGHIVLLGLKNAHQIWDESVYKILQWGRSQGAVVGFCHMQYLNGDIPGELTCCIPVDYPVEVALGTVDFLSEDVWINDEAVNGYYKILNCGFRPGWAAGTDFPCNGSQPFGSLLTYVRVPGQPLTYQKWIEGIRDGRTVVTTNGHLEFLDLKINGTNSPGDEIKIRKKGTINVEVTWTAAKELSGRIELVCNGKVIAVQEGIAGPGKPVEMKTSLPVMESSWICARRMDDKGHRSHTAPVYITVDGKPIRASSADAEFFVQWIDNILNKISDGGPWSQYFTHDIEVVRNRYRQAREVYEKIAREASGKR